MNTPDELQTLIERRNWLTARIAAKKSVGWETQYDERECNALTWAIERLSFISGDQIHMLRDAGRLLWISGGFSVNLGDCFKNGFHRYIVSEVGSDMFRGRRIIEQNTGQD